jgi:hypothetical protein
VEIKDRDQRELARGGRSRTAHPSKTLDFFF